MDAPPIDQNVAKLHSPLGSTLTIACDTVCNLHTLPLALDTQLTSLAPQATPEASHTELRRWGHCGCSREHQILV